MSNAIRDRERQVDSAAPDGSPILGQRSVAPEEIASALTHFDRAAALAKEGAALKSIVRELTLFVADSPDLTDQSRGTFVLRHAHIAFQEGLREEAIVLYDWAARNGLRGTQSELRRAAWRLQNNDPRTALRIVEGIEASRPLDAQGVYIKSRALLALDRPGEAVAPLKTIIAAQPERAENVRLLFAALERTQNRDELRHPEQFLREIPDEKRFEFLLRACIACEDYAGVARLLAQHPEAITGSNLQRLGQATHALVVSRDFVSIDLLFDAVGGATSDCAPVISAKLRALVMQKEFDAAEHLLLEAESLLRADPGSELCLRKLEYFCLSMQLDRAVEYLAECNAVAELPAGWTPIVAGLYSARGEWSRVFDLIENRLQLGFHIANTGTLAALGRAARFTGGYRKALELLDQALSRVPHEELSNCRDRLLCELSVIFDGNLSPTPCMDDRILNPLLAERARTLSTVLSRRELEEAERHIYFCTDCNYLAGTCVALFSLLRNNCSLRGSCAVSVVCADDTLDFAADILMRIGAAFGVSIAAIPANALLTTAYRFKTDWGLFAPGHGLSDAAYYRILAAQYLLARGARGRALYIDSDTWIGHGADRILSFDLEGRPLGAKPEIKLPEIAHAAAMLGIEPGKYFNSGVLLFDLDHPELSSALVKSIDIAVNRQELLTFVDQCALNLAFHDCYASLPEDFNWALMPTASADAIVNEPVILHYLARPKPWDPMYSSPHCMRWIREFAMLADLLTPAMRRQLLASQFPSGISAASHGA